eukprot:CAMPEP_0197843278 /NCGR_PEP_ID=MMETSP1438-20131217/116_1 /TAXON_ID=1461541 /ORGANISM="Pterosperma sp., Strain CCMP1384" /LENGTH=132 /DNA_ID=CAMNT_0043453307 /DNA_START=377 /DNA_END=775 /DNA_ORIENTATION=-
MTFSYWPFSTLIGATTVGVVLSFGQGCMYSALGDIMHNLKIHGDVEESQRESKVTGLQGAFDAMAVFCNFILVTYLFILTLVYRYTDEVTNPSVKDRSIPPGSTIVASSLPTGGNPYSSGNSYQTADESTTI